MERSGASRRIGTVSAIAGAVVTLASLIALVATGGEPWTDVQAYAATFDDTKLLIFVFWFVLAILFVIVVAAIHADLPADGRSLGVAAVAFATIYATIVSVNYALQFTFVRQSILQGNLIGLEPWIAANPNSAIFATDILGYLFQGLATLSLAPLLSGNRLLTAIRWLFVVNGVLGIGGIVAIAVASAGSAEGQALGVASLLVWGSLLSLALILVALAFRRDLIPFRRESPGGPTR